VSAPDKATLSSRTMATITAAARTLYPYHASLDEVSADAVVALARGQRRDLR